MFAPRSIVPHVLMGLHARILHCCSVTFRRRPLLRNHFGTCPRDRLSAVLLASDGSQAGEILHSKLYLQNSHKAKYWVPTSFEERPFLS